MAAAAAGVVAGTVLVFTAAVTAAGDALNACVRSEGGMGRNKQAEGEYRSSGSKRRSKQQSTNPRISSGGGSKGNS